MAHAMASPMPVRLDSIDNNYKTHSPVFPDVGSMTILLPGMSVPSFSAASIIAFAIRSLTDPPAEKNSTLPTVIQNQFSSAVAEFTHRDCILDHATVQSCQGG